MDVLTPVVTGSLLAIFTVVLTLLGKGQFEAIRSQFDIQIGALRDELREFKTETRQTFDRHEKRFDRIDERFDRVDERFDQVNRDIGAVRADITQLAVAMGASRPQGT